MCSPELLVLLQTPNRLRFSQARRNFATRVRIRGGPEPRARALSAPDSRPHDVSRSREDCRETVAWTVVVTTATSSNTSLMLVHLTVCPPSRFALRRGGLRERASPSSVNPRTADCGLQTANVSVIPKRLLHIRRGARLQQRKAEQHPRLLRVLVERGDEAQLVVVELDVALDAPDRDPRGADADDAFLESVCPERLDGIDAPRA